MMFYNKRLKKLEVKLDLVFASLKKILTLLLLLSKSSSFGKIFVAIVLVLIVLKIKFSLIDLLYKYICWLNACFLFNKRLST